MVSVRTIGSGSSAARISFFSQARSAGANGSKASGHRAAAALIELRPERQAKKSRPARLQQFPRSQEGRALEFSPADRIEGLRFR